MRILMLASYFPKPGNHLMGNWALAQANALCNAGLEMKVVSGTSWVPCWLALTPGAEAYAQCPLEYAWDGLGVSYPRWLFYSLPWLHQKLVRDPAPQVKLAWSTVRQSLLRLVDDFKPDLIYAHHTQINGYLALQLKRQYSLPYVITDHDFGELEAARSFERRRRFLAPIIQGSSRMVAVARRMEDLIRDIFPGAKTATVSNGTVTPPPEVFKEPRPHAIRGKTVIFCAAAFYERKGIPMLIRAFGRVAAKHPESVLRIAGDGVERRRIEATTEELGLQNRVALLGRLPHSEVIQQMAWSDVFALPGWDEPFATAFSEALSVGLPIVYSADGGITDVVENGKHGFAIKPRDVDELTWALDQLLGDEKLRRDMGEAGTRLFEERLKWEHNAGVMKAIFESAVRSGSG